jgi:hypothetical protein
MVKGWDWRAAMEGIQRKACEPGAAWNMERERVTRVAFDAWSGVRVAVLEGM